MTFAAATVSTRRATPSHQPWLPLPYMLKAVEHLEARGAAGLALDPGLRKTSITLEAFCRLKRRGLVRTMLVVAPLRVCRTVWRQEGAKWTPFRQLTFALLHGPKKTERLKSSADVYLINPEGVKWLAAQFFGRDLPFDIVVIDELTKFKNSQSDRSKALRPRLKRVARRWGLTGSLAPNGYMDLFGQQLMLDDGAALGRFVTHYRDQYFQVDWNGFDYVLQPGGEGRIIQRIAPYWLQMSADDYMELPPLVPDPRMIDMDKPARAIYDKMKKAMIAELPEGAVTAANAAACYSKLSQMANGAVYVTADKTVVSAIHELKLDALEELLEELNGQPLLLAYEFNHDLDRLRARFGNIPHLGKGTTATQEAEYIAAWNRNELPLLACHPASAGHGLNLQEGNAAHVCWFGITWDLELWDQFIRRIRRSGNVAQRIFNHMLIVRDTIDELKLEALSDKNMTQAGLLRALNREILRDAEAGTDPVQSERETRLANMGIKLSRPGTPMQAVVDSAPGASIRPSGWGRPAAEAQPAAVDSGQRERIAAQLNGGGQKPAPVAEAAQEVPAAERARSAFSGGVTETRRQLEAPAGEATLMAAEADRRFGQPHHGHESEAAPEPAKRTRRKVAAPEPVAVAEPQWAAPIFSDPALISARVALIHLVFNSPAFEPSSVEEGLEIAGELRTWLEG